MTVRAYRVAEVAIRVRDLAAMAAFYTGELGFAPHKSLPGVEFLEIGPLDTPLGRDGHPTLFALFARDVHPDPATSTFDHIAFEIDARDYAAERDRFKARDMVIREREWPETLPWKGRSFFIRDPENNVIEIIASLDE